MYNEHFASKWSTLRCNSWFNLNLVTRKHKPNKSKLRDILQNNWPGLFNKMPMLWKKIRPGTETWQ